MKGIAAINIIIILVLGVMALVAVIGMFMGVWIPAKSGTSLEAATMLACLKLRNIGCPKGESLAPIIISDFDANKDGVSNPGWNQQPCAENPTGLPPNEGCDNLYQLCVKHHGCVWDSDNIGSNFQKCCRERVCGCSG